MKDDMTPEYAAVRKAAAKADRDAEAVASRAAEASRLCWENAREAIKIRNEQRDAVDYLRKRVAELVAELESEMARRADVKEPPASLVGYFRGMVKRHPLASSDYVILSHDGHSVTLGELRAWFEIEGPQE